MKNTAVAALESTPRISVQARALHKALQVAGGLQPLSKHLDVPASAVREWMFDVGSPPHGVFLRVVELLLDDAGPCRCLTTAGQYDTTVK